MFNGIRRKEFGNFGLYFCLVNFAVISSRHLLNVDIAKYEYEDLLRKMV